MWGLAKLSSALLAATSSYAPKSVQQIDSDFRKLYSVLGDEGSVYKQMSPTIKFVHVSPPKEDQDWREEQVLTQDSHIMAKEDIFKEIAQKYGDEKPIALYLPGLDGFGISAASWQFNDLSRNFDLWRMTVRIEDRSSFSQLVKAVTTFINEISESTGRPVYIVAESFGGLLAPAVALNVQNRAKRLKGSSNPIKGLVLVNPATSFDESAWDVLAPVLSTLGFLTQNRPTPFGLPSPYAVIGGLTLSTLIPSSNQFQKMLGLMQEMIPTTNPSGLVMSIQGMLETFKLTEEMLPPGLLEHRIKNWMIVGSDLVQPRLQEIDVPTFIVVGADDKLIGSRQEADRLTKILKKSEKLVVRDAGHFVLDENVNLTEAIIFSDLDPLSMKKTKKKFDPILDWKLPPQDVIDEMMESTIKPLEDAFSPIFMSTDENGVRSMDLENLPKNKGDGPLLFVSNHQLLGLDLNLLISKFIDSGIVVRGLAHPIVFQGSSQSDELGGRTPGLQRKTNNRGPDTSNFRMFGAVMVTPKNYYRMLQSGQNALLFPGGVREVFHGRDEAYQLFWPEKVDFVRTAARFNATIIPVSAVGMADSLNILLEPSEIVDLPFIGKRARDFAANVTAARFDVTNEAEMFLPPIVAPGLPSRNYFIFGKPLSTKQIDPSDKESCGRAYNELQVEMRRGFDDILAAREKDAYKEAPQRIVYERMTGQKAPTFDIKEVNRA